MVSLRTAAVWAPSRAASSTSAQYASGLSPHNCYQYVVQIIIARKLHNVNGYF